MAIKSEGTFVWFDYVSPDVAQASKFYTELFGWTARDLPMATPGDAYTMLSVGDEGIGGLIKTPPGAPPHGYWLPYLATENLANGIERVKLLGGKHVHGPEKVGDFGSLAVVLDSLDGAFALWQPTRPEATGDYKEKPGTFCWNELYTQDTTKSVAFYSALAGFTTSTMEMKEGTYYVFERDGKPRGGTMQPPMPMPQAWMPYVQVASVDETIAKAKQLGANVHIAGEDVPNIGRIGIFSDAQGGMLGVLQPPSAS